MDIDLAALPANEIYHLMTQTVIPRPIAWILTMNQAGKVDPGSVESDISGSGSYNLAPFSFFNALASAPPTLMVSIGKKPDGHLKDTRANLTTGQSCVVHIAGSRQASLVSESSRTLDYGDSEVEATGMTLVTFEGFPLPRLAECQIAMGCEVAEVIELGPVPQAILLLTMKRLFISDAAVATDAKGRMKVLAQVIDPLARLGANEYAGLGDIIKLDRPQ